jgi:hypothetical protein
MNWIENNQKVVFLSFITVIVGITVLSLMPPISKINLNEKDKIGHFVAYTVLTINGLMIQKTNQRKCGCCSLLFCTEDLWNSYKDLCQEGK